MKRIESVIGRLGAVLLIVVFLGSACIHVIPQKPVAINGSLVDAGTIPLKTGLITPFYDPPVTGGDVSEVFRTYDNGLFGLEVPWRIGRRIMLLMEDRSDGFYPIDLARIDRVTNHRFFKGVVISEYAKSKELGPINNYVRYGQVIVDVRNSLPWVEQKILNSEIYVRIKTDDDQLTVSDTSFRPAYSKKLTKLIFYLPEGHWNLELYDTTTANSVLHPAKVMVSQSKSVELSLAKQ